MNDQVPLFQMEGISKRYGGVRALENADITIHAGRVHAILGENGAGKSTLIKVMSGVVAPDEGRMLLDGREVSFADPAAANAAGIVCIFQELSLIPELSVADNIVISNPPMRFGMIDRAAQRRIAEEALAGAGGSDIHPSMLIKDLPLSRRQIVEIAKALARKPRMLILDEATSALTASDVQTVFGVIKRLRSTGVALLYISHRMHEITELADDCTVFRNGRKIATYRGRHQERRRSHRDDDRPRISSRLSAQARAKGHRCDAGARGQEPHLGAASQFGVAHRARRRSRRPWRSRRPGPARIAARLVRGPARHQRRHPDRWQADTHPVAARRQSPKASAWR